MRKSKIIWIAMGLAVTAAGAVHVAYGIFQSLGRVDQAEHVAHLDWLPTAASDISYYHSYSFTAAEFRISEVDFRKWCDAQSYKLQEIKGEPFAIFRYSLYAARKKYAMASDSDYKASQESLAMQERKIQRGLCYSDEHSNGGATTAAFDRDAGIGYFASPPR